MDEDIFTTLLFNEPEALISVEPLDGPDNSFRHNTVILLMLTLSVAYNIVIGQEVSAQ
jgi:hypothetical protein